MVRISQHESEETPKLLNCDSSEVGAVLNPLSSALHSMFSLQKRDTVSLADGAGRRQLFVDQEKMKQQLRDRMMKTPYDVMTFYHRKGCAQKIARHHWFEVATLAMIAMNGLWISIDTDYNGASTILEARPIFIVAENIFCSYFFLEIVVRFFAFEIKSKAFRDAWFLFDSFLVILMVVETWVLLLVGLLSSGPKSSGGLANASVLKMARFFRLARLARLARLLRSMPELMILIRGMVAATRSVLVTLLLLLALVYVFAVAFRQLTDGGEIGITWFPTVLGGMHTLIIHGAFMDDLASIAKDLEHEAISLLPIFYLFLLLAALTLMNMLIGVLCEVVSAIAATEKEAMTIDHVKHVMYKALESIDRECDGDGRISMDEFLELLQTSQRMRDLLQEVGVDVIGLVEFAEFIFTSETIGDEAQRSLSYEDLMNILLDLRGSNMTSVRDIVDLRRFVKQQIEGMERTLIAHQRNLVRELSLIAAPSKSSAACSSNLMSLSLNANSTSEVKTNENLLSICKETFRQKSSDHDLEVLLSEWQTVIGPLISSLDDIKTQLVIGLQAEKRCECDLAHERRGDTQICDQAEDEEKATKLAEQPGKLRPADIDLKADEANLHLMQRVLNDTDKPNSFRVSVPGVPDGTSARQDPTLQGNEDQAAHVDMEDNFLLT